MLLKSDGYVLMCTPNLAGWQEVFSLFLGFQPFNLTNVSRKISKLNPIKLRENEEIESFPHMWVFTFHGFLKLAQAHGFRIVEARGCGYFPFVGVLARMLEKLDPRHINFIVVKLRRDD